MAEPSSKDETTRLDFAELFNVGFAGWSRSPTMRHIWRKVYGEDYPEEVDPFSFVTVTDLRRIARELRGGAHTQVIAEMGEAGVGGCLLKQTCCLA